MFDVLRSQAAGRYGAPPRSTGALSAGLLLAAPALLFTLVPAAAAWFEYDRGAIASGQLWRGITCHWTHWSVDHLVWDLVAFVLLVWIGWRKGAERLLVTLLLTVVSIPVAVWIVAGEITRYRGLSGIDSALFTLVALTVLSEELSEGRPRRALAVTLVLAGFVGKIVFETTTGGTLFADSSDFVPMPLAHVVGAVCGCVGMWITSRPGFPRFRQTPTRLAACVRAAASRSRENCQATARAFRDGRRRLR
jgi:rhomboid family GlyGly-CTERM serine protease